MIAGAAVDGCVGRVGVRGGRFPDIDIDGQASGVSGDGWREQESTCVARGWSRTAIFTALLTTRAQTDKLTQAGPFG